MSIKLLVVDDAPFIREIVRQLLRKTNIDLVAEALDGEQAIQLAQQHRPDVILMDIVMPNMSGIEATKRILEEWPDARIVACSTLDQQQMVKRAMDAGCVKYVTKPFSGPELIETIKEVATS